MPPTPTTGVQWFPLMFDDFHWIFLDFHWISLIFLDFHWCHWIFIEFHRFLLKFHGFSLIFIGFQWIFNDFHWFSLIFNDFQGFSLIFNGFSRKIVPVLDGLGRPSAPWGWVFMPKNCCFAWGFLQKQDQCPDPIGSLRPPSAAFAGLRRPVGGS